MTPACILVIMSITIGPLFPADKCLMICKLPKIFEYLGNEIKAGCKWYSVSESEPIQCTKLGFAKWPIAQQTVEMLEPASRVTSRRSAGSGS